YIDNSLTLGAFAYSGQASLADAAAPQMNSFTLFGGDFNGSYDRFNLFGAVQVRKDDSPFVTMEGISAKSTVMFAELDVTVFPWLLPGVRYEVWNGQALDAGNNVVSFTDSQIVPGIVALIRPNVKMTLRASFAKQNTEADPNGNPLFVPGQSVQAGQVVLALAVGI
ncbi:MAG TPA: hypothetical protein VI758_08190, partial [Bacteroidota bacterium]